MGSKISVISMAAQKLGITLDEWLEKRQQGFHWCYICRDWLHTDFFTTDSTRSNKLSSACKACNRIKHIAYRYKISIDEARELDNLDYCAICKNTEGALEIDHNHSTGVVRGVICSSCNSAIGLVKEDIAILEAITQYLRRDKQHGT